MATAQELLDQGSSTVYPEGPASKIIQQQQQYEQDVQRLLGQGPTSYDILVEQGVLPPSQYESPVTSYSVVKSPDFGTFTTNKPTTFLPKVDYSQFEPPQLRIPPALTQAAQRVSQFASTPVSLRAFEPPGVTLTAARYPEIEEELKSKDVTIPDFYTEAYKQAQKIPETTPAISPAQKSPLTIYPKRFPTRAATEFTIGAAEALTPSTYGEAATAAALGAAWGRIPKVAKTAFGLGTIYAGVREFQGVTQPSELGRATAITGLGAGILAPRVKGTYDFFRSRPVEIRYTPSVVRGQQFTRQRATVVIVDKNGKILYQLNKKDGKWILPGGDIKPKETPFQAAKREVKEELVGSSKISDAKFKKETGIDLKKLNKIEEVQAVPEENQIVFELKADEIKIKNLKPQRKEIADIVLRKPAKAPTTPREFVSGIRTRLGLGGNVRTQDAVVVSRYEALKDVLPAYKKLDSREKAALINLARSWGENKFGKEALSKISKEKLVLDYILSNRGLDIATPYFFKTQQTFMRRGEPVFLTRRVPKASERTFFQRVRGKKPGTFVKFQREPPIALGGPSRYDVPGKFAKQFQEYPGSQYLVRGSPGRVLDPAGRPVSVGSTFIVTKPKRGYLFYFQPPRVPGGESYLGASYLGIAGRESPRAGFTFFGKSPTVQYLKSRIGPGEDLILSRKALRGTELEAGAKVGTVFKVVGKSKPQRYLGRRVDVERVEIVKTRPGELTQKQIEATMERLATKPKELEAFRQRVKRETGVDYGVEEVPFVISERIAPIQKRGKSERVEYLPSEAPSRITIPKKTDEFIEEGPAETPVTIPSGYRRPEREKEKKIPYIGEPGEEPPSPRPPKRPRYRYVPYSGRRPTGPRIPRYPPSGGRRPSRPRRTLPPYSPRESRLKKRKKGKDDELFVAFVRRYGEFKPVTRPVSFETARKKGIGQVRATLGASLQVRRAKTGQPVPLKKVPTGFRLGREGPITLVQRRITPGGGRLATRGERQEIISARRVQWIR